MNSCTFSLALIVLICADMVFETLMIDMGLEVQYF